MRARTVLATLATVAGAVVLASPAEPVGAAVVATSSGTGVGITLTGDETVRFTCVASTVRVNGTTTSPPLGCAALTQVTVVGDSGNQAVHGAGLDDAAFAAGPKLVASLADGADYASETARADQLDLGVGDDTVELAARGAANTSVNLGTGTGDALYVHGTADADSMVVTSTSGTASVVTTNGYGATVRSATNVEWLTVAGGAGGDTIDATGITGASALTSTLLQGDDGDDLIKAGPKGATIYGGSGTNQLKGGTTTDAIHSESTTDKLDAGADASTDYLYDETSLHSGGRLFANLAAADVWSQLTADGDVVERVRPGPSAATSQVTTSLARSGQQLLPTTLGVATISMSRLGRPAHRAILDVHAGAIATNGGVLAQDSLVLDVTVPSGAWTVTTGGDGYVRIDPSTAGLQYVSGNQVDAYRVHGPWTNANQGFGHRVTRDLLFRFPTDAARDLIRDQLTAGTRTRAQVAASLMNTDEYRGLDVDRVFVAYLRRASDPGGRAYWIDSLRNGKSLRQFRAQLFGSSEYFTKAGGTNEQYMVQAYADVLGRLPDPSGQAYWTNKLDNGADRGSVAKQFLASTEARRNIVNDQFLRFLDRKATPAEETEWIGTLSSSINGEQGLIGALAASSAYYGRS